LSKSFVKNLVKTPVTTAVTSLVGGIVASKFGFDVIFIAAGALSFIAALLIFMVPELALPPSRKKVEDPEVGMKQRQGTQQPH